ncbi:MAG TPA: DUF2127 domain-containing protein [Amnibacterium sp.]|uniref:DUF2127 domain-containing protein n=1 Tax=Amnibacterium sp. TaxID=1872496 RepID=UPI002F92A153
MTSAVPEEQEWVGREVLVFRIVLILKGLDGVLELVGGALLLIVRPSQIQGIAAFLTRTELQEDPRDFIANHVLSASHSLVHDAGLSLWGALYLLVHGLVKVVLVWAVLRDRLWAYPWMIGFLAVFIAYQGYAMVVHFTWGLLLLTLLDVVVVWLTVREYRRLRRQRAARERIVAA